LFSASIKFDTYINEQPYLLNYNHPGCRCYHFGNSSKLSKNLEEYKVYGGLGLDKDKVISLSSLNNQVLPRKMN